MWLKHKLKGAQGRLFAEVCVHYITAAQDQCNDTPEEVPIFSWLSPNQRLNLVSEVMIGVLCEDEPMPPDTIQHKAAFSAMVETLFTEIIVELDSVDDEDYDEELIEYYYEQEHENEQKRLEAKSNLPCIDGEDGEVRSDEEKRIAYSLIEYRAERNKEKLKQKKNVKEFHVETSEDDANANANENMSSLHHMMIDLFHGGPISPEQRRVLNVRPTEKYVDYQFRWRKLCDAALQEDCTFPLPLACVDFDWRCSVESKWFCALNMLLNTKLVKYGSPTDRSLLYGEVNAREYADSKNFPRIRAIEEHVEILRKIYESKWDRSQLSIDQRCIFAIGAAEVFYGEENELWATAFINNCEDNGVDFSKGDNYQKRFNIFRTMQESGNFTKGLDVPYGECYESDVIFDPSQYKPDVIECVRCYGPGDSNTCMKTENLRACSRCKVAMYCSAECQRKHWKTHKLVCDKLAADRKKKKKIAEMAKK